MKKITTYIILFLLTITLASCTSEGDTFKLNNFSVSSIKITEDETLIYNSDHNISTENNEVFLDFKTAFANKEFYAEVLESQVCEGGNEKVIEITTNNGVLKVTNQCIISNNEEIMVTHVEITENFGVYTDIELYEELLELSK